MILTGLYSANFGQNLHKLFLKLAIIGRTKTTKSYVDDEPQVRPFRDKKAQRSEQAEKKQYNQVMSISAMRPSGEFP
jgi:hypothetical protein